METIRKEDLTLLYGIILGFLISYSMFSTRGVILVVETIVSWCGVKDASFECGAKRIWSGGDSTCGIKQIKSGPESNPLIMDNSWA